MSEEKIEDTIKETSDNCSNLLLLPEVKKWCSTGCTVIDIAIANRYPGGIPLGRVTHAFGGGSTGKSALAASIAGFAIRSRTKVFYSDIEHTLDPLFAKYYGLDCENENFFYGYSFDESLSETLQPTTLEEFFDIYLKNIVYKKTKKVSLDKTPKIVILDTITMLPSEVELGENLKDGTYGTTRAKQIRRGFRKYNSSLSWSDTTVFCIDQASDNIGGFGGPKEVTSGGRFLEYGASVTIHLTNDSKIVNNNGSPIGIWVKFKVVKNKVASPFKEGRFKVIFDYGLDNICTNLYFLSEFQNGPQKAKNKTTTIKIWDEQKTTSSWVKYIEENNKEKELEEVVWKVWQEKHKTDARKPKVW